ncbi:hypothetical protein DITRI_Ditri02bG0171100 [Diplodiscus trichospermus]
MTVILLLLSIISTAIAQPRNSHISLGSSLTPTGQSAWLSPSRLYAFGFYEHAKGYPVGIFLAGVPQRTVVWTANRDDPPVPSTASLLLTADGRLIIRSQQGRDKNIIDSSEIATASMLDTGNFVLYDADQNSIWQSFEHPTTTILPGQRLSAGMELFSSVSETDQATGIFRLKMQNDGNLVQYPVETPDTPEYACWSASTDGSGDNLSLNLDNDGHLYLLNSTGNIKDLNKNRNQSIIWSSTYNKCHPIGLCGLNGYCVDEGIEVDCKCLPGFSPVIEGNFTAGCERNFSSKSCKSDDERIEYTIRAVENTEWEDA